MERRWARWGRDEWLQRVVWGGHRARVRWSRLANKRAQLLVDEGYCVVLMVPTAVAEVSRGSRLRLQRLLGLSEVSAERQSESGQRGRWPVSDVGATSVRLYGGLAGLEASKSAGRLQRRGRMAAG